MSPDIALLDCYFVVLIPVFDKKFINIAEIRNYLPECITSEDLTFYRSRFVTCLKNGSNRRKIMGINFHD